MRGVDAGVNYCHDASAADIEAVLCVRETDDLRGRLGGITVPDKSAVIVDRRLIIQAGRDTGDRLLRNGEELVRLNTLNAEERFEEIQCAVQEVRDEIARGGNQKSLPDSAIERPLYLAARCQTKVEHRGEPTRGPDYVAALGRGGLNTCNCDGNKDDENK